MTVTPPAIPPLRVLVRHPLSALRPSAAVVRAADRCSGMLRHPRSRIRVAPGWRAPSLQVRLPSGPAEVFVSRHRVSTAMWRRLTGARQDAPPPHGPLFLVTLSAFATPAELDGPVRSMTADVHSMFRRVLSPAAAPPPEAGTNLGDTVPWHVQESCGSSTAAHPRLEWTWHALVSGQPGVAPAKPTSSGDRASTDRAA